ncbi:MAG: hypothetical protein KatS3mg108_2509 [Isosphaeraceae bacterium]|jgi:biopolymer transport protein ExbD|nr:MAG: hypothetical protein KatS3mg108_2509 [Isosphaeraceae bacterium]
MNRSARERPWRRGGTGEASFPVTPMLDVAFQLLIFFLITYEMPSNEARLDLLLLGGGAAERQGEAAGSGRRRVGELEIRVEADSSGGVAGVSLAGAELADLETLERRLARHVGWMDGRPVRVRLVAADRLRYGEAARVIGAIRRAGVVTVRLAGLERSRGD